MNVQTDVIEIGKISVHALTSKVRPLLAGYSIGPFGYPWTGTLGCIVYRTNKGPNNTSYNDFYVLSNNDVLANGNLVPIGTPIIQPSSIDGGSNNTDGIGMLSQFVEIKFDGSLNTVDCAIAKIRTSSTFSTIIPQIGYPTGVSSPKLNSTIQKNWKNNWIAWWTSINCWSFCKC